MGSNPDTAKLNKRLHTKRRVNKHLRNKNELHLNIVQPFNHRLSLGFEFNVYS
jgi:hypothetical protein